MNRFIALSIDIYSPLYKITVDEINITVDKNIVDIKSKIRVINILQELIDIMVHSIINEYSYITILIDKINIKILKNIKIKDIYIFSLFFVIDLIYYLYL